MADIQAINLKLWVYLLAGFFISLAMPNMAQIFGKVRATYEEFEPAKVFGVIRN